MKKQFLTLLCVLLMSGNSMFAATWLVQKSGGATWTNTTGGTVVTIGIANGALENWFNDANNVSPNDDVWIIGNTTFVLSASMNPRNGVSLYGGFDGTEATVSARAKGASAWTFTNPTTLDGNNAVVVMIPTNNSSSTTTMDGLTITKGLATTADGGGASLPIGSIMQNCIITACKNTATAGQVAGGVTLVNGAQLLNSLISYNTSNTQAAGVNMQPGAKIEDCTVDNNTAETNAGGIYLNQGSGLGHIVKNCIITNNKAKGTAASTGNGGGIMVWMSSSSALSTPAEISNCTISNNTSESSAGNGGGIGINDTYVTAPLNEWKFTNCTISGNSTTLSTGGGFYYKASGTVSFNSCTFDGNTAGTTTAASGGGASISGVDGTVTFNNTIFKNNSSRTTTGGAILANPAGFTANNCLFTNNTGNSVIQFQSTTGFYTLNNCTVASNVKSNAAAAGLNFNSGLEATGPFCQINNSLFYACGVNPFFTTATKAIPVVNYCAFDNTATTNNITKYGGVQTTWKSITSASFKNVVTGDYRLSSNSTAIDAGTTIAVCNPDLIGTKRPMGAAYDMGAYEYANFWTGTGNWSTAANWSEGTVPASAASIVVSSGTLNIDQAATVTDITANSGTKLTLNNGVTLTVNGNLALKSDATNGTATFVNEGGTLVVSGKTNVEQYLGTTRNWYVSSPVSNAKAPVGFTYNIFNEVAGDWTTSPVAVGDELKAGVGYIALPSSTGKTITFTTETGGTLNLDPVDVTLTKSGTGFNLIGNPYPCHLGWTYAFASANSSKIGSSIWVRTNAGSVNNSGQWSFATFNASSALSVPSVANAGIIAPNQAFWVKAIVAGTLTLNSDLTKSHQTGNALKAPAVKNTDRKLLRLEVSNGTAVDEALVYFDSEALNIFDTYDSPKMFNNSSSVPDIYTVVGNEKLVINGLNQVENNMEMVLGFNSLINGNFSFKTTEMTNFDANTKVYLRDKVANTETELLAATEYSFASDITTNNETRFSLVFKAPSVTTAVENKLMNTSVFVNAANETVIIAPENTQYSVYNSVGQSLTNGITKIDRTVVNTEKAGIYIVKLANQGLSNSYRLIVR